MVNIVLFGFWIYLIFFNPNILTFLPHSDDPISYLTLGMWVGWFYMSLGHGVSAANKKIMK